MPTAGLRVLFVLLVLAHHRRRVLHFNITEHPTAAWTAQQIVEAFPDETAPAYLLRDRDAVYGQAFRHRLKALGISEVLAAARSPWQNAFVERLIGSVRRECLDHMLVLGERHLRHILTGYFAYYHGARTHLALEKDAPDGRPVVPAEMGPRCGGNSRSRWPTPSVHTPSSIIGGRSRAGQVGMGRYCRCRLRTASQPQHTQIIPAVAPPTSGNLGAESVCQGGRARRYFGEGQASSVGLPNSCHRHPGPFRDRGPA